MNEFRPNPLQAKVFERLTKHPVQHIMRSNGKPFCTPKMPNEPNMRLTHIHVDEATNMDEHDLMTFKPEDLKGDYPIKVDPAKFYREPAPETKIERFAREVLGIELTAQQMEFMSDIIKMQAEGKQIVIQRGRTAGQATLRKVMAKYLEDGLEVEDAR